MNRREAYAAGYEAAHEYFDVTDRGADHLASDETFAAAAFLRYHADLYERSPTTGEEIAEEFGVAAMALETAFEKRGEQLLEEHAEEA
ncbi:hypothetical protein ACFPYI_01805 [Halomarina salina]|uniref:Uncharacterized protein n=1 Tax=Halomarina salina TaxID=1872699 RepID=A0ABD5RHY1_9EURY|nr:hypothetical protein [Halomarina salina]